LLRAPVKLENNARGITSLNSQSGVGIGFQGRWVDGGKLEMFQVLKKRDVSGNCWLSEERTDLVTTGKEYDLSKFHSPRGNRLGADSVRYLSRLHLALALF
jgi:hypothetical protein